MYLKKYRMCRESDETISHIVSECKKLAKWQKNKDQFALSYFSTSLIVLIQVYNWEIRHHSLVCGCELADILYIL